MNLRFLETLLVLARVRNFRETAEQLRTTQPAVSARVRALERELGVQLFVRTSRHVSLTPEGLEAVRHAERILAAANAMTGALGAGGGHQGIVRLGVIDAVAQTWLPRLIEQMRREYPRVTVEITADVTVNLMRDLREGLLHLGYFIEPLTDPGFTNVRVCSYEMAWIGRPDLFAPDRPLSPEAIAQLPLILFPLDTPPHRLVASYFADEDLGSGQLMASERSYSNSLATMIRLAIDGLGIAPLPPVTVQRELAEGALALVPATRALAPVPFYAVYPRPPVSPLIALVVDLSLATAAAFCASTPDGAASA